MPAFRRHKSVSPGDVGNCSAKPISRYSVFDARKCWQSEMWNLIM